MPNAQLRENKYHGSALFPFNIYPCTIPSDFLSVPLHWQNSMEVIFIKRGNGLVQVGLDMLCANAGDIFILPPGRLHALRQAGNAKIEYENIIFSLDFLFGGADDICTQKYLLPLQAGRLDLPCSATNKDDNYAALAAALHDAESLCAYRPNGYELGVKAALLRFLSLLFSAQTLSPTGSDSADTAKLKDVLSLISTKLASPLSVDQAAESCGWSSSHFMRWFKKMTGVSFTAFVNEQRLAQAAEALRSTDDKIVDIAGRVGFENLSNFNRQFKARYGVAPHTYRTETA
ncbi:MAG: AraC family transcriptional regulator [Clostridia bacterium]|nr:AraC family transcriptional regulator [Clostridia bacterium]NLS85071.1 AraC family transcriptional regulator [Oscillospiraceae bacterium]